LGRIVDEIDKLGLSDDTLVVYTSDHGSHFRTRNGEYKRSCHEASVRIPLIARGPGFGGGTVINQLVSLIDIAPTLLRAGRAEIPRAMRGRPLQPLVAGQADDWPEEVFVQISESQVGRALRTTRWKYSVSAPGKSGGVDSDSNVYVEEYLYDLERDPHERTNLVRDHAYANTRAALSHTLKHRMKQAGEEEPTILPAAEQT
jgi:arylsulfatase A-like enzyme